MKLNKNVLISLALLGGSFAVVAFIFFTEPEAQREGATRQSAMLVEVVSPEKGDFNPVIKATGTVRAVEDVILSPMVNGQVVERSSEFIPGGYVKKGEMLLRLNASDYRNNLELRRSELLQAQTQLNVEMGRQQVAKQDLQLIGGDTLSDEEKALVLREPQLAAVQAAIRAAKANVDQAQLDLDRTVIRAPFDAHVLRQNATLGSQVAPGDDLGRLVGTDHYWVEVSVPVNKIQWLEFPQRSGGHGSTVIIRNSASGRQGVFKEGFIDRQIGALDDQTRLARVLVRVPDPMNQLEEHRDKLDLMIGSFVEVEMQGLQLDGALRLDRGLLRNNNTVWVMKEGKLEIREVDIILTDANHVFISDGLEANDRVVTTNLSTVTNGIALRTRDSIEEGASGIGNTIQ